MKLIQGDLLDIKAGTILHQVNCRGAIGGLAGALHKKWPSAFTDYFAICREHGQRAQGLFLLSEAEHGLFIGHVFGQIDPGPETWMSAVSNSLGIGRGIVSHPVYAPFKMGCGIGGGNWARYLAELVRSMPDITIVQRLEDATHG